MNTIPMSAAVSHVEINADIAADNQELQTGVQADRQEANTGISNDNPEVHTRAITGDRPAPEMYYGPYDVTPTEEDQTLLTASLMATDDITVRRIPEDYIIPAGTKELSITENNQYTDDVKSYENICINVDVPIPPEYVIPTGTKGVQITENGDTTENIAGYENVAINVNVPVPPGYIIPTGTKQVSITQNGTTTESVKDYENAEITVNVPIPPGYIVPEGVKTVNISKNGQITEDVTRYASATINVAVPFPETQSKTVTPTESEQTVTPDSGKLLSFVTVNPIPSQYADVSGTTAQAADVKSGKTFVAQNGNLVNGAYLYDWKGEDTEFLQTVYDEVFTLDDTTFPSWTPANTASAIKASVNAAKIVFDMVNYDYLLEWQVRFDAAYEDGATLINQAYRECAVIYQAIQRNPNSVANIQAKNFNGNRCVTLFTTPLNVYYNANGNLTYTYSVSYGIYGSATAATFSNSTAASPTVTIKTPAINARCHDTYFAMARAPELDTEKSTIHMTGKLYRSKVGATLRSMYGELIDLYDKTYE